MNREARIFRSKIDYWFVWLIVGIMVASFVVVFTIPLAASSLKTALFIGVPLVWLIAALCVWPTEYRVTDAELLVRCGLIRRRFPLSAIVEVAPRGVLAGPRNVVTAAAALSLDRLLVSANADGRETRISISPADKSAFMEDLHARDAGLDLSDGQLRRKGA